MPHGPGKKILRRTPLFLHRTIMPLHFALDAENGKIGTFLSCSAVINDANPKAPYAPSRNTGSFDIRAGWRVFHGLQKRAPVPFVEGFTMA